MKGRWKGLCALWMALALAVYAFPTTIIAEDSMRQTEEEEKNADGETTPYLQEMRNEFDMAEKPSAAETVESSYSAETGKVGTGEGMKATESTETVDGSAAESGDTEETVAPEETTGPETTAGEETAEAETVKSTDEMGESSGDETDKSGEEEPGETAESTETETNIAEGLVKKDVLEPIVKENLVLKAAVAERAGETSVAAWLYLGSGEVTLGTSVNRDDTSIKRDITVNYDTPFNEQEEWNVTAPSDKELSGWNLWRATSGGIVDKDCGSKAIDGVLSEAEYNNFNIVSGDSFLLIVPTWKEVEIKVEVIEAGKPLNLVAGKEYMLPAGPWTVNDDTTIYTGGYSIYVLEDRAYTFRKQE